MDIYDVIRLIKWHTKCLVGCERLCQRHNIATIRVRQKERSLALADVARCCFQLELSPGAFSNVSYTLDTEIVLEKLSDQKVLELFGIPILFLSDSLLMSLDTLLGHG